MLTQLPELLAEDNRAVALTRRGKPVLALMPWDLFQSIIDTLEIMGDAEIMADVRRGIRDLQEGNLVALDEVRTEFMRRRAPSIAPAGHSAERKYIWPRPVSNPGPSSCVLSLAKLPSRPAELSLRAQRGNLVGRTACL